MFQHWNFFHHFIFWSKYWWHAIKKWYMWVAKDWKFRYVLSQIKIIFFPLFKLDLNKKNLYASHLLLHISHVFKANNLKIVQTKRTMYCSHNWQRLVLIIGNLLTHRAVFCELDFCKVLYQSLQIMKAAIRHKKTRAQISSFNC